MMLLCERKVWTDTFQESCQLKVTGSIVIAIIDCLLNVVTMDGVLQLQASVIFGIYMQFSKQTRDTFILSILSKSSPIRPKNEENANT